MDEILAFINILEALRNSNLECKRKGGDTYDGNFT